MSTDTQNLTVGIENSTQKSEISFDHPREDTLLVRLSGSWKIQEDIPSANVVLNQIKSLPQVRHITFDTKGLTGWDSGLLTFLIKIIDQSVQSNIKIGRKGLPAGVYRLLNLAFAVPERKGARREEKREPFFARIGNAAIEFSRSTVEMLNFIGEVFPAFLRMFLGKARFRRSDLFLIIQETGAQALPIVSLISFLVGLIFAFVGAIQLELFGAQIYVADLVGIAIVREMGAIMTGIVMAGRTGAAFAAQLGTMQVNEEIDSLETLGISPMEFLVLPRMLALVLMMPLLCLYADLMGILGGFVVGVGMLDISAVQYYNETRAAVGLNNLWIGLFMSVVFGFLVALAGCLRGMQCGRSASSVGIATTSAVVTGIVSIIVATAIITVMCEVLSI
jgi:phospholipid/cholesterol/gamma-HCH transport system permease protein